jgi:hypothetical protein
MTARPFYETESDIMNAASVAEQISSVWGCEFVKMKRACVVDYALKRDDKFVAVMEVKCRNYSSDEIARMGGLILSAHKVQAAKTWKDTHRIAFVLAIGLTDGIFVMSIKSGDEWPFFDLTMAGRYDRGDPQDVEPCVLIPMNCFRKLLKSSSDYETS